MISTQNPRFLKHASIVEVCDLLNLIRIDQEFPTRLNHLLNITLVNGDFYISAFNDFKELYTWFFQGFINGLYPTEKIGSWD